MIALENEQRLLPIDGHLAARSERPAAAGAGTGENHARIVAIKALTIKQPWAWAICHAGKRIENRSWQTSYRGTLAIHAGAKRGYDSAGALACEKIARSAGVFQPSRDNLASSAIVATCQLVDCVELKDLARHERMTIEQTRWAFGPWCWILADVRPLAEPIPCAGALSLWQLPAEIQRQLRSA